jgi:integration host factor subunit beta
MATITKKDLIERIAEKTKQRRALVKKTVQDFLDAVIVELGNGNRLEFREFGVFEIKERSARIAQNPKTLQRVEVPAKLTVRFKSGRKMRECLDGRRMRETSVGSLDGLMQVKPAGRTAGAAV